MIFLLALDLFARWLPAALIGASLFGSLLALPWLLLDMLRRPAWPRDPGT
jgi:hypothetical protein